MDLCNETVKPSVKWVKISLAKDNTIVESRQMLDGNKRKGGLPPPIQ